MHVHLAPWLTRPDLPFATVSQGEVPPPETTHLVDGSPREEWLDEPALRAVIVPWAGISGDLARYFASRPHLRLYNLHVNAQSVAELALGLLLGLARGIPAGDAAMRQGRWTVPPGAFPNAKLHGMTAALVGYGSIGRALEPMLHGLGVRTLAVRRRPSSGEFALSDLAEVASRSNVLMVSLPLNAATQGSIDRGVLMALQWPRLVVNVGRGPLIVESDFYEFLREGHGYGASDVWYRYPSDRSLAEFQAPSNSPFHELPNFVMSPHRAGATHVAEEERTSGIAALLGRLARGEGVEPVDPDVG